MGFGASISLVGASTRTNIMGYCGKIWHGAFPIGYSTSTYGATVKIGPSPVESLGNNGSSTLQNPITQFCRGKKADGHLGSSIDFCLFRCTMLSGDRLEQIEIEPINPDVSEGLGVMLR